MRANRRSLAHSVLVVGVLVSLFVATGVAFIETERLKLVRSSILDTVVTKQFAPSCGCATDRARILFRLRRGGLMVVQIITPGGKPVRRLAAHRFGRGFHLFAWYGENGAGLPAPDGAYKVKVRLVSERRTIVLPNVIRLDRTPPRVLDVSISPSAIRPSQRMRIAYKLSEPGHPLVFVDGRQAVTGRWPYLRSRVDWFGRINGRPLRPGKHLVVVRERDLAGNISTVGVQRVVELLGGSKAARRSHRK